MNRQSKRTEGAVYDRAGALVESPLEFGHFVRLARSLIVVTSRVFKFPLLG